MTAIVAVGALVGSAILFVMPASFYYFLPAALHSKVFIYSLAAAHLVVGVGIGFSKFRFHAAILFAGLLAIQSVFVIRLLLFEYVHIGGTVLLVMLHLFFAKCAYKLIRHHAS